MDLKHDHSYFIASAFLQIINYQLMLSSSEMSKNILSIEMLHVSLQHYFLTDICNVFQACEWPFGCTAISGNTSRIIDWPNISFYLLRSKLFGEIWHLCGTNHTVWKAWCEKLKPIIGAQYGHMSDLSILAVIYRNSVNPLKAYAQIISLCWY